MLVKVTHLCDQETTSFPAFNLTHGMPMPLLSPNFHARRSCQDCEWIDSLEGKGWILSLTCQLNK